MSDADIVRAGLYNAGPDRWKLNDAYAALDRLVAERDALLRAARVRVEYGHNDTCDSQLGMLAPEIKCSGGHDALLAALDAVTGGHQ